MTFEGLSMTYRELEEAANRLAHLLAGHGVGPGGCVALLLSRSAEAIVAMVAVLKTGAAYLPIDPAAPGARIGFMLEDAAPIAAITTAGLRPRLDGCDLLVIDVEDPRIDSYPCTALPAPAADVIAYIIYTSGSTGVPKGVGITHHNVTQLLASLDAGLPRAGVWTQCHSYAFDVSVWEIFGALLGGGRLVVVPEVVAGSPADLHAVLVAEQVSVLTQTPSAVGVLSAEGLGSVALVMAGEAVSGRGGGAVGAGAGDGQRLRPDRDHDVCGGQCAFNSGVSGVGGAADRVAGVGGGVVCAGWVVAGGAGGGGRGVVCGRCKGWPLDMWVGPG